MMGRKIAHQFFNLAFYFKSQMYVLITACFRCAINMHNDNFIYLGFNVAFNTLYRSYHDG